MTSNAWCPSTIWKSLFSVFTCNVTKSNFTFKGYTDRCITTHAYTLRLTLHYNVGDRIIDWFFVHHHHHPTHYMPPDIVARSCCPLSYLSTMSYNITGQIDSLPNQYTLMFLSNTDVEWNIRKSSGLLYQTLPNVQLFISVCHGNIHGVRHSQWPPTRLCSPSSAIYFSMTTRSFVFFFIFLHPNVF